MNNKLKFLSLVLGGFIAVSVYFSFVYAKDNIIKSDTKLPQGTHGEEIAGLTHQVEYHYGGIFLNSLEKMLKNDSLIIYPEDRITVFPNPNWGIGGQIIIKRANQVIINDAGKEKTLRTWAKTVDEVLRENKIAIGQSDIISPAADQSLADLMTRSENRETLARESQSSSVPILAKIIITRVSLTELKEYEEINYKTITREDANLERGIIKTEQEGKKGQKELFYEVRRENGVEVSRKFLSSQIIKEPQEKIIIKGTKVVVYGTGTATWYSLISGMTAAHNSLPKGAMVHVINTQNNKSVDVKIIDRGIQSDAVIDLSADAFRQLAPLGKGVIEVRLEKM